MTENWTLGGSQEGRLPGKKVTSTCGMENDKGRRLRDKQTNRFQHLILSPAERELAPSEHPPAAPPCSTRRWGAHDTLSFYCVQTSSISNVCLQQGIPFLSETSGSKLTSELLEHNAFRRGEFFPLSKRRELPIEQL